MKKLWSYRILYILILLATLFTYIWTNTTGPLILLILLIVIPMITAQIAYLQIKRIQIQTKIQSSCIRGQQVFLKVKTDHLFQRLIGKLEMEISFDNIMFQTSVVHKEILRRQNENIYFEIPVDTMKCGRIGITISSVACYDAMNLFSFKKSIREEKTMVVFPKILKYRITQNRMPRAKETGELYDQKTKGQDVSEVFAMREYQPGDSIRAVHWKVSSKMDKIIVREYSTPANYNTIVLFDLAYSYQDEKVSEKVLNSVMEMVVSISDALLRQSIGHQVGALNQGQFFRMDVGSQANHTEMMTKIMSLKVEKNALNTIRDLLKLKIQEDYTKIIYVTGGVEEAFLNILGNWVDLSVVVPVENKAETVENRGSFEITTISVDAKDKTYNILI